MTTAAAYARPALGLVQLWGLRRSDSTGSLLTRSACSTQQAAAPVTGGMQANWGAGRDRQLATSWGGPKHEAGRARDGSAWRAMLGAGAGSGAVGVSSSEYRDAR
jgi:hypothetical protein